MIQAGPIYKAQFGCFGGCGLWAEEDEGFDRCMFPAIEMAIIWKGQGRDKPSSK